MWGRWGWRGRRAHTESGVLLRCALTLCCCAPARAPAVTCTALVPSAPPPEKSEAQITQEIQAIIRQITASVTFLPLLQDACECAVNRPDAGAAPEACTFAPRSSKQQRVHPARATDAHASRNNALVERRHH